MSLYSALRQRLTAPQPIERLALLRIALPLIILGFLSSRLLQVEQWLTAVGFVVPDLHRDDFRQPLYLAPLSVGMAKLVVGATVASGLAVAAGLLVRVSGGLFAGLLIYLALADRLAAFTVSKLGAMLILALWLLPSNARYSIDSWLAHRRQPDASPPTLTSWGSVRFFQILFAAFYCSAGLAKVRGDWLGDKLVIWSHIHGSYQTAFALWLGNHLPVAGWWLFQWATLVLEVGAPLWFAFRPTRRWALLAGIFMHAVIGLCFAPLLWFSLLMIVLLCACFAPLPLLQQLLSPSPAAAPPPSP